MEVKKESESNLNNYQMTLFKFELNPSQASLFLITFFIGIFMLSFSLTQDIFLSLFSFLFDTLPTYLSEPEHYHEDYLVYHFWPIMIRIIISIIFLLLSIYGLRKILKNNHKNHKNKRKIIPQERIVNWLGIKISHGQSLFIFSASLAGIFIVIQLLIEYLIYPESYFFERLFDSLCWIPDGPNQATSHEILMKNVPLGILATFLLLCLYSLIITRRGKPVNKSKNNIKNYSLLIFIVSFVVLIFLLGRIFCHLALFNSDISDLLEISSNSPNKYQYNDFIKTIISIFICLTFMTVSFFLKEGNDKELKTTNELSWLNIKLTSYRAMTLLSSAILLVIYFTRELLFFMFLAANIFVFPDFINILFPIIILIAIIFFFYYPIDKLLKNHNLDRILENIKNSEDLKAYWFKFRLNKKHSVVLFSVSGVLVVYSIYELISINNLAQIIYSSSYPLETFHLFSFPLVNVCICILLVVLIYTIKRTFFSIKSRD